MKASNYSYYADVQAWNTLAFALGKGGVSTAKGEEMRAFWELYPSARKSLMAAYKKISKDLDAAVAAGPARADQFAYLRPENQTPAALRKKYITLHCLSELLHLLHKSIPAFPATYFAAWLTLAPEHFTLCAHSFPCSFLQMLLNVCAQNLRW